jgi:hypothetical protein
MTLFWGAIGYVLGGFAPGYLLVRAFRIERLLPPLAGPFALSLIFNCIVVEVAVWFGAYTTTAVRVAGSAIVSIFVLVLFSDRRLAFGALAERVNAIRLALSGAVKPAGGRLQIWPLICGIAATIVVLQTLYLFGASFGSILVGYDPVVQWNAWAVDWAANRPPNRIYHYPQLVPILWSIPYALMGNSAIEFFSSSYKFVFWLLTFETLVFLSWRSRDAFLLLSLPIAFVLFQRGVGGTALQDSIDVPVAFFALLSVATVLLPASGRMQQRALTLALVLAGGAAMTKQVGLYMIGAIPLLHLCWTLEDRRQFAPVLNVVPGLVWRASVALMLCAPIYVYAVLTIRNGSNVSEFGYLFDEVYENRGRISRAIDALQAAFAWFGLASPGKAVVGVIACAGFVAANLASLRDRRYRWILLCINIPFSCLWAIYFSYDRRNLALTMPLWALTSAVGLRILLERYLKVSPRPFGDADSPPPRAAGRMTADSLVGRYGVVAVVLGALLALVLSANSSFTEGRLLARQNETELQILAEADSAPLAPMLSLTKDLGAPVQILSEWRWGCAFHFNRTSGRCLRITSDDLFRARLALLARSADASVLLILLNSSINSDRERTLAESGFVEKRTDDGADFRYFVRDRRG